MPFVLIDANAIVERDWYLATPPWEVMLYRCRTGQQRVVVLDSTVIETAARYEAGVTKAVKDFDDLARRLSRLGVEVGRVERKAVGHYEESLRGRLANSSVEVKPATIGVMPLVRRAAARARPFDQKGTGFRDALLWEEAIALLKQEALALLTVDEMTTPARCSLITRDKRAFYAEDGRGLHPDLGAELTDCGLDSNAIALHESIAEFLLSAGSDEPALLAEVIDLVQMEEPQVARNIGQAVWAADIWNVEYIPAVIEIGFVYDPESVTVEHVISSDSGPVLVELSAECRIELSVDPVAAGYAQWTAYSVEVDVPIHATARFDRPAKELSDFTVNEFAIDADIVIASPDAPPWM